MLSLLPKRLNISSFSRRATLLPALPTQTVFRKLSTATSSADDYSSEIEYIHQQYEEKRKRRGSMIGTVISVKNKKTINIRSERSSFVHISSIHFVSKKIPLSFLNLFCTPVVGRKWVSKYQKYIATRRNLMAHDEFEVCRLGDFVRVIPCRPMSRTKRHTIYEILVKQPHLVDYQTPKDTEAGTSAGSSTA